MARGPAAGLDALDRIAGRSLRGYHLLPAARADFLRRLDRREEAVACYRRALELADNRGGIAPYGNRSATAIRLDGNASGTTTAGGASVVTDRYRQP